MTATASTTNERAIPAGKCYFDPFDANKAYTGERYLNLTPGFTISVKSESTAIYSMEDGILVLDSKTLTQVSRTGKLTCRQTSLENVSNFIIGDISTYTQSGASVTNESLMVLPDRYYQIGKTIANPPGRQGLSAVSMTAGDAAITWVADTAKVVGDYVKGVTSPTYYFKCTAIAGDGKTHATTEPTWSSAASPGQTVVDDMVTWTNMGILTPVVTPTTGDFDLDTTLGRIYVRPTAHIHPTIPNPWSCDYTYASNSRRRIVASALASVSGGFHFVAFNMEGENRDVYAPNALMEPSGEWKLKDEKPEFTVLAWDLTFSQGINGEPPLFIDGRAV